MENVLSALQLEVKIGNIQSVTSSFEIKNVVQNFKTFTGKLWSPKKKITIKIDKKNWWDLSGVVIH